MDDLTCWLGLTDSFNVEFILKYVIFVTLLAFTARLIGEIINNLK